MPRFNIVEPYFLISICFVAVIKPSLQKKIVEVTYQQKSLDLQWIKMCIGQVLRRIHLSGGVASFRRRMRRICVIEVRFSCHFYTIYTTLTRNNYLSTGFGYSLYAFSTHFFESTVHGSARSTNKSHKTSAAPKDRHGSTTHFFQLLKTLSWNHTTNPPNHPFFFKPTTHTSPLAIATRFNKQFNFSHPLLRPPCPTCQAVPK